MKCFAASRAISIAPVMFVASTAVELRALHVDQGFEDALSGIVDQDVQMSERPKDFLIGSPDVRLIS